MFKQSIYYFISVVDDGSFSAAGKKYFLSQSAISQQISRLENELGFNLFDRQSYRPCLTDEGKQYYELCKKIVNQYENELQQIEEDYKQKQNTITVGITGPFEKKIIPSIIKSFKNQYDVTIDVKVSDLQDCILELKNRSIDVGFGLVNDFKHSKELVCFNIYSSHVCVVTSLNHPLSHKDKITIDELKDEPIVILSKKVGTYYYEDFMKSFELDGINPKVIKEVDNLDEYLLAIQLDEGIGLSAFEVIPQNEDVCTIELKSTHHHADYAVGYHVDNQKEIVIKFVDEIISFFKDYK